MSVRNVFFSREAVEAKEALAEKVLRQGRPLGIFAAAEGIVGVGLTTYARGEFGVPAEEAEEEAVVVLAVDDYYTYDLPRRYRGVRVVPWVVGRVRLRQTYFIRLSKVRPLMGGVSVGSAINASGTLTCIVYDRSTGEPLILSNDHVLGPFWGSCQVAYRGLEVLQPGPSDLAECKTVGECPIKKCSEDAVREHLVGYLERWVPVRLDSDNYVDAAVAKLAEGVEYRREVLDLGVPGPVAAVNKLLIGQRVRKSGRTTAVTEGKIRALHVDVKVEGWGTCLFRDQIATDYMAEPGDSGSLGVLADKRWPDGSLMVFGLLFAGSEEVTFYNRADLVEQMLNISFAAPEQRREIEKTARQLLPQLPPWLLIIAAGSLLAAFALLVLMS